MVQKMTHPYRSWRRRHLEGTRGYLPLLTLQDSKDFLIQVAFEIGPQILIAYNLAVRRFHQDDVGVVLIS